MMWIFGDVWSTPEEAHRLADLIETGLRSGYATEGHRFYLHQTDEGWEACLIALALIGDRGSIMVASDLLDKEAHENFDGMHIVAEVTGISEELLKRATRWHGEGVSAAKIIQRLKTRDPKYI